MMRLTGKYHLFLFCTLCLSSLPIRGQVVYDCNFESMAEREQWRLNLGANPTLIAAAENHWYIDFAGNHNIDGQYGLFMSNDGANAVYTNEKPCIMYAYRELQFEEGDYLLTFDWICNTALGSGEGIYVALVPDSDTGVKLNSGGQVVPTWMDTLKYGLNGSVLGGTATWQIMTRSFHISPSANPNYKLVFMWYQTGGGIATPPPACIDNIRIFGEQKCAAPSGFAASITEEGLVLTWGGPKASFYDIKVYDYQEKRWQVFDKINGRTVLIQNLSEGVHDIYVRAHCDSLTSEYIVFKPFYYHKGARCIDYMDLTKSNCYIGQNTADLYSPFAQNSKIDFGYTDYTQSRHTVHFITGEYDPSTENRLKTKPDDALASVRLGSLTGSYQAQGVIYKYKVSEGDKAILKLRYACVLPNPHPEQADANPKFELDILHNGQPLDGGCGHASFTSGLNTDASWHEAPGSVLWKDWTEVAVNLRDYQGETITIKLSTGGCTMGGHGGYAYFTLDCESGGLEGINCGDIPTTQFIAPSGFNYQWYLPTDPEQILSKDQIMHVDPMDTLTYNVDVISKTNGNCYYTLDATAIPRFPVAETTFKKTESQCENTVIFHQTCHVKYKNQITEREWHTDMPVENIVWDFGDGSKTLSTMNETVTHTFPRQGGTYTVRITAGIRDTLCQVTSEYTVTLPDIYTKPVLVSADICEGDCYYYNGRYYCNTYIDTINYSSDTGCDSTVVFHIIVHDRDYAIKGGICEGESYDFAGEKITEPGTYVKKFKSSFNCDSVVTLTLDVKPRLQVSMRDTFVCFGDPSIHIPFVIEQGVMDSMVLSWISDVTQYGLKPSYTILPEETAILIPIDTQRIVPIRLQGVVHFYTPYCPVPDASLNAEVRYSAAVFTQKDGLLALMNQEYSGYDFVAFQWYRDDEKIEGATYSVLSATDADLGHIYRVEVKEKGMEEFISTCEIPYTGTTALNEIRLGDGPYRVYSILGHYVTTADKAMQIHNLPTGIYIISDGKNAIKVVR